MAEVFISYAREGQGFARDLNAALQKLERDTWIDWRSIPDSAQWRAEIFAAIGAADNFLFIISLDSLRSWMCGQEVAHAVANRKRIVTILYHPVEHDELSPGLKEVQWINYPELGFESTFQRLITALDTDLEWVRHHTRFGLRAAQWEASGRDSGFLLHGTELREAVRWLEQSATLKTRQPTEDHEQYIRASEEWEAGEIQRLKDLNDEKDREKRIAVARELVAFSTLSLEENPERSILLAMHAMGVTRPGNGTVLPEAEDALHRAVLRSSVRSTLRGHSGPVTAVAMSRDGRLSVSASEDRTLRVWEVESGRELRTLEGHSAKVTGVAMSEDGRLAVSASWDKTLKVWDVETGRELRTLQGHTGFVNGVAVSGDGRFAVSASEHGMRVWHVDSGTELGTLQAASWSWKGHMGDINSVALSRDGGLAVSAGFDHKVNVWDVGKRRQLRTLWGHSEPVNGVALRADGRPRGLRFWRWTKGLARARRTRTTHPAGPFSSGAKRSA